jgi:hypothetical protein
MRQCLNNAVFIAATSAASRIDGDWCVISHFGFNKMAC